MRRAFRHVDNLLRRVDKVSSKESGSGGLALLHLVELLEDFTVA